MDHLPTRTLIEMPAAETLSDRQVALFVLTSGTVLASGTHYLAAGVVLLVGVWAATDRVRKGRRLPLAFNSQWLNRVIDIDLTLAGRGKR